MKIRHLLSASFLLLFCASPLRAEPPADADSTAKLVGIWDSEANGIKGTDVIKGDGTFTGSANGSMQGTQISIAVEGKWSVKDGVLTETIIKSDHPEFVPIGAVTHDKLLEVTDKTYRARTESGAEELHVKR